MKTLQSLPFGPIAFAAAGHAGHDLGIYGRRDCPAPGGQGMQALRGGSDSRSALLPDPLGLPPARTPAEAAQAIYAALSAQVRREAAEQPRTSLGNPDRQEAAP